MLLKNLGLVEDPEIKRKSNPFSISQTPWSLPINNDNFIEPVSLEGVEKIHNTAMRILEDMGSNL